VKARERVETNQGLCCCIYLYGNQDNQGHLEVVSDLTTDAFLNAFKHFISHRGKPSKVYSDNTNFVGANRELEKCREVFSREQEKFKIVDYTSFEGIKWHFISAHAPHFEGLWESAVIIIQEPFLQNGC